MTKHERTKNRGNRRPAKRPRTVANRAVSVRRNPVPTINSALLRAQVYSNIVRNYPGLTMQQVLALVNAAIKRR